ncbi:hypothetical protein BJY00DRAFT_312280 [Aspergillus carlsbadensis]|nr:hypothetical protein BJY00DRAFT_312280 [Aspergillus carlsbadensis]
MAMEMASLFLLLLLATSAVARDPYFPITLEAPTNLTTIPADDFVIRWAYTGYFDSMLIIGMAPATTTRFDNMTSVHAHYSSTTLPALHPGQTSVYTLQFFTTDRQGSRHGTSATDVTLSGPIPTTVTFTETLIEPGSVVAPTGYVDDYDNYGSTEVSSETSGPVFEIDESAVQDQQEEGAGEGYREGDGGLSTGAKAGIGIGAGCAAISALAFGGVMLYRRWRRRDGNGGIPEKSLFVDRTVDMSGELRNKHGAAAAEIAGGPTPWELPVPALGGDRASRMRYELGG